MAVQLKRLLRHHNFTIYEKSDNIGGTWWHNQYPSCACDIPSHFYSYSFDLKPDWTTTYPGRDELHQYFFSVAEKFGVLPHCRFNTTCTGMQWDSKTSTWTCSFENTLTGEMFTRVAPVVISAIGTLDRPYTPRIAGAESFKGDIFHSARWDYSVDPKDKNIVVLGNGASATQFVPELVKNAGPRGKVTQLVKSAHWWTKRGNPSYSTAWKLMMKYVPLSMRVYRLYLAWQLESVFYSFLMTDDGARRRQKIRDATYHYIEHDAPAEYHDVLRPDYEPGCKRRVNTATYLECLHSPRMHLAKERVVKIEPDRVTTDTSAQYDADAIIFATGFLTQEWLLPMEVKGSGGKDIHQVWNAAGGAEAYKGTVVGGFPNFFILYGPNSATGQHSVIFHSECQINYACRLLRPVLTGSTQADYIVVKPEAQKKDLASVHQKLQTLVFNSGCQSWWMNSRTKKNTFIYPDPMYKYWLRTIFPTWSDFEIQRTQRREPYTGKALAGVLLSITLGAWALSSGGGMEKSLATLVDWSSKVLAQPGL
ncbi:monooxygenase y4iD [Colletotrichum tofieldiae]|uniref:Monooxygenase y4iD n=1 Tax=Colletotrichum tofieldiae TaxID=708197 RepID=A0A166TKI8_9PEZI|nr:monooxygenase y4iD [Colletotrichum tofieldiae]GKT58567.1 monooxygenase y4iD [Colletotrichum tofieldiae]GKT78016.1 monooxygenase y4iD [Colletotrichum tofieldiae]GKT84664.1 monooxygenase y4iD [Colletotrichum tofieldiae]